jgi:hypothetical protein
MKTVMTTNRKMQWMAAMVAALATVLTMGGSMTLAAHYAKAGARPDASGYYAAGQARRAGCPGNRNSRTAEASLRDAARTS